MKNIQTYEEYVNEKFSEQFSKAVNKVKNLSIKGLFKKGLDFGRDVWDVTKREGKETAQAVGILRKMIRGEEVSDKQKEFLKSQAKDVVRILPLIAIQGLPGGSVAITPLLLTLGKKYNFDIIPSSNSELLDEDEPKKRR